MNGLIIRHDIHLGYDLPITSYSPEIAYLFPLIIFHTVYHIYHIKYSESVSLIGYCI